MKLFHVDPEYPKNYLTTKFVNKLTKFVPTIRKFVINFVVVGTLLSDYFLKIFV